MAFLERRRFTFFDVHNNVDGGKIAECLQDTSVSATTSGNNHIIICDVTGLAHIISRSWEILSFKAYELTITLAQQLPHDPYLVTIGWWPTWLDLKLGLLGFFGELDWLE
ncbi:PREDICTED: uncharacterized protein LOC106105072 [Papilio polytes]|uniref:uncharacterized protein LOC106105072 n=1 Tax=Papilio polytes TaxID=76194 RepID=UPI000675D87F|nr:PREDICTED: uncharacterized protein LOC106105072 [Papilio polytes]